MKDLWIKIAVILSVSFTTVLTAYAQEETEYKAILIEEKNISSETPLKITDKKEKTGVRKRRNIFRRYMDYKTNDRKVTGNRGVIYRKESKEAPPIAFTTYKVVKGDSLSKIAKKVYNKASRWQKIYEANKDKIKPPRRKGIYLIYPGQILRIPRENKGSKLH
jgi:nucleoid-associated protein YgaU